MISGARSKIWSTSNEGNVPIEFDNRFSRETVEGVHRVIVAARGQWIDHMLKIVNPEGKYFYVIYQQQDTENDERFQSGELTFESLQSLMTRFRDLIEISPWHNFWVYNIDAEIQVVLDEHNLMFVYGHLDDCVAMLLEAGFVDDKIELPFPHLHLHAEELSQQVPLIIEAILATCD